MEVIYPVNKHQNDYLDIRACLQGAVMWITGGVIAKKTLKCRVLIGLCRPDWCTLEIP